MSKFDFDLITLGAGSGGVRASRLAGGYGARVAVIEVERRMQLAGVIETYAEVSVSPQVVAILNHSSLQDLIEPGDLVKLVLGGAVPAH